MCYPLNFSGYLLFCLLRLLDNVHCGTYFTLRLIIFEMASFLINCFPDLLGIITSPLKFSLPLGSCSICLYWITLQAGREAGTGYHQFSCCFSGSNFNLEASKVHIIDWSFNIHIKPWHKWDTACFQLTSGWGPFAYFRALEEMHTNSNSAPPPNGISVRAMEAQATNLQARTYRNPVLSPEAREERSPFDDVECGRRWFCGWVYAFVRVGCAYICS